MLTRIVSNGFPRVQLWRRTAAFFIDFVAVWLVSGLLASILPILPFFILFLCLWLVFRVFLVVRNHGQSLGRYALDMAVIEVRFSKVPGLLTLTKREGILGLFSFLAATGLSLMATNPAALLLFVPLAADCGLAWTESSRRAFHDMLASTLVVGSRRGYSLDLKVKRLVAELARRVK